MVVAMKLALSRWVLLSCVVLFSGLTGAAITVSTDRSPARANESFQLYFQADGSVDGDPDFSPLLQYFSILNNNQSSNISVINGNYKRSTKWTLQVMPKQAGTFIVPAIRFGSEKSRPFEVKVNQARQPTASGDDGAQFEFIADKASIYVQSQVVVTLRLISDTNISDYKIGEMDFNGMDVVVEDLGDIAQYQTKIDGRAHLVLEKKYALFPQQSGTLTIEPIQAAIQLGNRSRSLFDPFQDSGQVVRLHSEPLSIEVLTKAESFKASHWLPSTGIQLSEDWQGELEQLTAGIPITRTITMTAEGLTAAQLPELVQQEIQGINQYPDKPTQKDRRSGAGVVGKRQQKIALIATKGGRYTIPEISIPWWNLETDAIEYARIPSRVIEVQSVTENASNAEVDSKPGPLATNQVTVASPGRVNYFWVWLSAFLAAGWIVSMLAWWFGRKGLTAQRTEKMKATGTSLSRASRRLRKACTSNDPLEARDAILVWANALKPERGFTNLNQVTQDFDYLLKPLIDDLNQGLYSQSVSEWNGRDLWSCCEQIMASMEPPGTNTTSTQLRPLNP
jgi:hypothetical protein